MKNKSIIIVISAILVLTITGVGFCVIKNKEKKNKSSLQKEIENNITTKGEKQQDQDGKQEFVVDVDMNMNNWQTKETEFFTIKFPKEWYWLESDLEKTGYHSQIITNNFNFDINKNASMGVSSNIGPRSPIFLSNNTEVVITDRSIATSDAGTPQDSIDAIFKMAKKNNPSVSCGVFNDKIIPYTAYCSATYDSQLQQSYYVINSEISLTLTVRTTKDTLVKKEILDKVVESIILKQSI